MADPRLISAGNFSNGMMPDQIGAENSAAMIMDGVIDRAGEVKLRGAKTAYGNVAVAATSDTSIPSSGATLNPTYPIGVTGSLSGKSIHAFASMNQSGDTGVIFLNSGSSSYTAVTALTLAASQSWTTTVGNRPTVVAHGGELIFPTDTNLHSAIKWAGSTKADYSTGTVAYSAGDLTITGTGTAWLANVEVGQYINIDTSGTANRRFWKITHVTDDTHLEVDSLPEDLISDASSSYVITSVGQFAGKGSDIGITSFGEVACSHQGRLFFGNSWTRDPLGGTAVLSNLPHRIRWSYTDKEVMTTSNEKGIDAYDAAAFWDVAPGVGGAIKSMESFGGKLYVFKESAIAVLSGSFAKDGTDLGAREDLITAETGSPSYHGTCISPIGLVWADRSGVWTLNGDKPVSLTAGKIRSLYRDKANSANSELFSVSSVGDRIIVQLAAGENTFVMDINNGSWTMQDCDLYSKVLDVRDTDGDLVGEIAGQIDSATAYFDKWNTDLSTSGGTDNRSSTTPSLKLVTQPIDMGSSGSVTGRPHSVVVDGFIREAGSTDPYIAVSLLYGASDFDTGEESAVALDYTITEGTSEDVHRIPVDAGDSRPRRHARVMLESEVGSGECKIYGVWLAVSAGRAFGG